MGMVRFVIIGVVIAVAFILYALVDAAMTDASRARGVPKPVWVVLVVVLPVIGGLLWFTIGKGRASAAPAAGPAPDDDPRFTGAKLSDAEMERLRELEERLQALDAETFPGEESEAAEAPGRTAEPESAEPESGADEDQPEKK